ncbi:large proline-rich protein BAG6-like isoform X2 [Asterias rubens]|uniref:large proline-rich protein BAG6-like isoform X2 n=1 Tax=Asterias rubens TaxID=7604 RepID=UPI001455CC39|nr:large proline-rich protein BAG6-like isoform X2 [Asterias rubens]
MMDVTVKTLDSQTRQFSVPEQITVKEFKDRIAGSVNIPASTQRLIFCGRVLQDSKKLSEYEVHGCTIHLVEKPPPSTAPSTSSTSTSSTSGQHGGGMSDGRDSFFMGAITVQADIGDAGNIHVQQPNGSHMDVHINLGPINMAPPVSASQQRITQIRNLLRQTHLTLERLENPPQQQGTQTDPVAATGSGTPTSSSEPVSNSSTTTSSSSTTQTTQQPSSTGGATPSPDSASNNQTGQGQAGRRTATVVHPRSTVMADILQEIAELNTRLQPHLTQYRELLISDPVYEGDTDRQPAHRLQTLVNQTLHYISHIYHAVSDCMMDLHTTPPRVLRAPAGMMVAPIRPAGQMPVHVNIGQMAAHAAASQGGAAASTEERPSSTTSSSTSQQNASTRTSSTATTQTQNSSAPPLVTNASVTLTNQQTYVITPRSGATGYMAVPVSSSSSNQTPGATTPSSPASQGGGRGTGGSRPAAPRPSGPHVHIHQLGLNPGSIPPAGLLQVMAQMVGQQQMQQMAQTPANHAGPTNTSSTPTTSSPRSQQNAQSTPSPQNQNQSSRTPNPMAFFNPLQPRPAWDPLLPCNSRHITMRVMPTGPAGRGRAGGGRQNTASGTGRADESAGRSPGESGSAGGENVNAGDGAQNNAMPQMIPVSADGNITDVIGGLVNAILNQQPNFVQVVPPGAQQTTQQASSQQQRQQPSQSSSNASSAAPSGQSEPGPNSVLSDQMLMNMMLRMTQEMGSVGSGQSSNQSLRNFLSGMGMALEPGEGFLGELLDQVTEQLGMGDFASMFLGQSAPLQQLRPNLERFVNQRIMRGQPLTPENIEAGVNRILEELRPAVTEFINGAPTVNNIDPVATHMKFLHSVLEKFVRLFAGQEESAFGEQMRRLGHDSLHQWVALMVHIFGSRQNVDEFLSTRMRTWFGVDATPGSLVATMSLQNFDLVYRMLTVTPDQIAHFVVKKKPSTAGAAGPATPSTTAASGSSARPAPTPGQSQGSLDNVEVIMEAEIHVPDESMNALVGAVGQAEAASRDLSTPSSTEAAATPVPLAATGDAVAMDTSGWEAAVPAEWVPVINQDIGRQRRQAPQGGLSDAYLAGMPPKRMKLTQDKKSPINNGVETFLPGTLRQAVQAVGAQPLTGVDALVRDAEASSSLYDACEEQVRSAVQERLRRDPDYDAQKFPNTDKYINKKK